MQCLFLLNITLKNKRLYLLTALVLHIDRLHRQTARDTEGGWGREGGKRKVGGWREGRWGEAHSCTFIKLKMPDDVKRRQRILIIITITMQKKHFIFWNVKNYPAVWKMKWVRRIEVSQQCALRFLWFRYWQVLKLQQYYTQIKRHSSSQGLSSLSLLLLLLL